MDITVTDQKGAVAVWTENVPTQQEATTLQKQEVALAADKKKILNKNVVAGLVKKSNRILVTASTHRLPFDLFPDTVNVEEGRVTIITRDLLTSQVHSVDIKDISNVFLNMSPFFAQLVIVSKTFIENQIQINKLWKDDAVLVRRIIEGLRVFESKQIDTSTYTREDLVVKLKELSTTGVVT